MADLILSTRESRQVLLLHRERTEGHSLVFIDYLLSLLFLLESARILSLNPCRIDIIPIEQIGKIT